MCISACGDREPKSPLNCGDAIFSLHFRKRNCRLWVVFPRGGNVNVYLHLSRACGAYGRELLLNLRSPECNILIVFLILDRDRIPARGECKLLCASPLAGMQYFDCISASETVASGSYSYEGECKFLRAPPLAGTVNRNDYKISACGDVKFWLHTRKRKCLFWIAFPRGGSVAKWLQNLRLRGCKILIAFLQAGPARGSLFWIVFLRGGSVEILLHLRLLVRYRILASGIYKNSDSAPVSHM